MSDARSRVSKGRSELAWIHPFFSYLLLKLRLVQDDTIGTGGTMATDGFCLTFHPPFVDGLTFNELIGVLAHEVLHIANAHHLRRGGRHHLLFNIACDLAINPLVIQAGFVLPKNRLYDIKYIGWSAEAIYDDLVKNGCSYVAVAWGVINDQPSTSGGAMSATEMQAAEAKLRMDISDAARVAERAGKSSDMIRNLAQEARETAINWRERLRSFVSKHGPVTSTTWRKPSRRGVGVGLYLPAPVREQCPPMGVIIDSSGSINQTALGAFLAEMRAISEEANPEELNVGVGGMALSVIFSMLPYDTIPEIKGGGGTRLQFMVNQFAELYPQTTMLVVLTDLVDNHIDNPPAFPVMWLVWGEAWKLRERHWPTYGEIVPMKDAT